MYITNKLYRNVIRKKKREEAYFQKLKLGRFIEFDKNGTLVRIKFFKNYQLLIYFDETTFKTMKKRRTARYSR